ncbi:MAG: hypothetical protein V2A73_13040, partial [Pseudomonadota bacterium]
SLLFAAAMAVGLGVEAAKGSQAKNATRRWIGGVVASLRNLSGKGIAVSLGLGVVFGGFLSFVWTPVLSKHFSYKNLFKSYFDHRTGDEPLAVLGIPGSGPEYYARGSFEKLSNRSELLGFLGRGERVFAIASASELCAVHQEASTRSAQYHVLDNRSSRFLLLTNKLTGGETDQNPLLSAIGRSPPASMKRPVTADFEGTIELIGADLPDRVGHGERFSMTLFYRVNGKPSMSYKVFVHFDTVGSRFQGDHDPIDGRCGTTFWQAGDYITDTFPVTAGELTNPRGTYSIYVGFFTGSAGRWKNMVVRKGDADSNNRVKLGSIQIR